MAMQSGSSGSEDVIKLSDNLAKQLSGLYSRPLGNSSQREKGRDRGKAGRFHAEVR